MRTLRRTEQAVVPGEGPSLGKSRDPASGAPLHSAASRRDAPPCDSQPPVRRTTVSRDGWEAAARWWVHRQCEYPFPRNESASSIGRSRTRDAAGFAAKPLSPAKPLSQGWRRNRKARNERRRTGRARRRSAREFAIQLVGFRSSAPCGFPDVAPRTARVRSPAPAL